MRTLLICLLICTLLAIVGCSVFGSGSPSVDELGKSGTIGLTDGDESQSSTQDSQDKTFAGLRWMIYAGITIMAFSAAALFFNKNLGIAGLAGGGMALFMAITLNQHLILISYIGLGVGIVGLGILLYILWTNRKELAERGAALLELIEVNELAKPLLPAKVKAAIYGDDVQNGISGDKQSATTAKIVSEIRAGLEEEKADVDAD